MNANTTEAAGVAGALRVLNGVTVDSNLSTYDWGDLQRAVATLQARLLAADELREAVKRRNDAEYRYYDPELTGQYGLQSAASAYAQARQDLQAALAAYDKAGTNEH